MSRKHRREQARQIAEKPELVQECVDTAQGHTQGIGSEQVQMIQEIEPGSVSQDGLAFVTKVSFVPKHKQCPLCWGMHKGQGVQYARYPIKQTKYFKCQNCGHTWSAVIVEHVKEINERIPEDLSER